MLTDGQTDGRTDGLHQSICRNCFAIRPKTPRTAQHANPYMWTFGREDKFSSFFRSSPDLKYLPEFSWLYMFLPYSPEYYMIRSQMCNLHHVHLGQGSKMQIEWHTCDILNPLHSAEVFYSHFKICFNNFIYPPLGWLFHTWLMIIWIFVSFNSKFQNIFY